MTQAQLNPITLANELREAGLPFELSYHPVVESTQMVARQLVATHGAREWMIVAGQQTAGRGRLDRTWVSQAGDLTCTFVWPLELPPDRWGKLGLLGGMSTATAIRTLFDLPARVKWPNDVFLNGGKLAGCLGEIIRTPDGPVALLGVGVNVVTRSVQGVVPQPLYPIAALGSELATAPDLALLAVAIAKELHSHREWARAEHDKAFATWWEGLSLVRGQRVTMLFPDQQVLDGVVVGLTPLGALLLETDEGEIVPIVAADVRLARTPD